VHTAISYVSGSIHQPRCKKFAQMNTSRVLKNHFLFWMIILCTRWLPSCDGSPDIEGRQVEIRHDVENDGQIFLLDLGKRLPNSRINAILHLKNKTGKDLTLGLKPSCGCTHLSIKTLVIPVNGDESIRFDMLVPMAGTKRANIRCRDDKNTFEFTVNLQVEASEPVKFAKKRYVVASDESEPIEVRLATNGDGVEIAQAELTLGSRWLVQKTLADATGWSLFLKSKVPISEETHEEYVNLNCTVVDKGERSTIPLELRIEFSDRFRLGPSFVVPKFLDDKVTFTVFATGVGIRSAGSPRLVLKGQDGTAITELRLDSPKTRNESLILTGSLEKKEFDKAIGVLGSDKACLELSFGKMSNLTKLKVDIAENRP
jgi:hypothetical protein